MGDYRGGSYAGGLPVVVGKASENTIPKFSSNALTNSSIKDNGSNIIMSLPLLVNGITVSKLGAESTISFPAAVNDNGYIKHIENSNVSEMRFCVSDDNVDNDLYTFGNTESGIWRATASITAAGNSSFRTISSTVETGTPPFNVASRTMVPGLNAEMVNGYEFDQELCTGNHPSFAAIEATGGESTFTKYGTSFNDPHSGVSYAIKASGGIATDTIRSTGQITSTVANGTPPFVITSTTTVANLSAALLNGVAAAKYALLASPSFSGKPTAPTAAVGDVSTTLATTAFVAASNVDMVDGIHGKDIWHQGASPTARSHIRVERTYASNSQSFPSTTTTRIKYDSVKENHLSEWNVTDGQFVAKADGIYAVNVSYSMLFTTSYNSYVAIEVTVYRAGERVRTIVVAKSDGLVSTGVNHLFFDGTGSACVKLAAGEAIAVNYAVGQVFVSSVGFYPDDNSLTITRIA